MRVKNTGDVPLRTQGPDPGYTYSTNDSYSSIEGGALTDKASVLKPALGSTLLGASTKKNAPVEARTTTVRAGVAPVAMSTTRKKRLGVGPRSCGAKFKMTLPGPLPPKL